MHHSGRISHASSQRVNPETLGWSARSSTAEVSRLSLSDCLHHGPRKHCTAITAPCILWGQARARMRDLCGALISETRGGMKGGAVPPRGPRGLPSGAFVHHLLRADNRQSLGRPFTDAEVRLRLLPALFLHYIRHHPLEAELCETGTVVGYAFEKWGWTVAELRETSFARLNSACHISHECTEPSPC